MIRRSLLLLVVYLNVGLVCCAAENCTLAKNIKVGIESKINKRKFQEDRFYHGDVDGGKLLCVFDGHGGHEIAQFLVEWFPTYFSQTQGSIRDKMAAAFKRADNDAFVKRRASSGSTATVVFLKDGTAYFAHVGDSRALLEQQGRVILETQDHKPDRLLEYERILNAGGMVCTAGTGVARVGGMLAISRAIGDWYLPKNQVISEPEYTKLKLNGNSRYLVVASDGLWDTMSSVQVAQELYKNFSGEHNDVNVIAQFLVERAIVKGSQDNITVMVVDLLS